MAIKAPKMDYASLLKTIGSDLTTSTGKALATNLILTEHPALSLVLSPALPAMAAASIIGGTGLAVSYANSRRKAREERERLKALEKLWDSSAKSSKSNGIKMPEVAPLPTMSGLTEKSVFASDSNLITRLYDKLAEDVEDDVPVEETVVSTIQTTKTASSKPNATISVNDPVFDALYSALSHFLRRRFSMVKIL